MVKILASFFEKHLRREGGGQFDPPPPADFKHLKTSPVIGLSLDNFQHVADENNIKSQWIFLKLVIEVLI